MSIDPMPDESEYRPITDMRHLPIKTLFKMWNDEKRILKSLASKYGGTLNQVQDSITVVLPEDKIKEFSKELERMKINNIEVEI